MTTMSMFTARIPDENEPNRTADGVVQGANGQLFFFWLGDEAPDDDEDSDDLDGLDTDADEGDSR